MPELPEVETIVRGLSHNLLNRRILSAVFSFPGLVVGDPLETAERLSGQKIVALLRHGKYIVIGLERRRRSSYLVIHLRMTGNLIVNGKPGPHTRAILQFQDGSTLIYHDIRKFGRWQLSDILPERLRQLGPEPLEISLEEFTTRLQSHRSILKTLLLNQEFLRGLGNIYADEVLFHARIHPRTNSSRIGPKRATRLFRSIHKVLRDAIAEGGTTINNYVNSDGSQGHFQLKAMVYGREGQPCKTCGRRIRRIIVSSRSTHFCPQCQRL